MGVQQAVVSVLGSQLDSVAGVGSLRRQRVHASGAKIGTTVVQQPTPFGVDADGVWFQPPTPCRVKAGYGAAG